MSQTESNDSSIIKPILSTKFKLGDKVWYVSHKGDRSFGTKGTVIRVPVAHLVEGNRGVEIRDFLNSYDVEFAPASIRTFREDDLIKATALDKLLFF